MSPRTATRGRRAALGLVPCIVLGGCSTVGPVSIDQGRTPYNEVIQTTSEQQTLLNVVRASMAETPLFMDVTEVDAVTSVQVNAMGGQSGIGAILNRASQAGTLAGPVGAVTAGAQYGEAPTVRYQPTLGAALVAQVSKPVSATSLVDLYNSGWPLGSIFDLAVTRFTPGYDDYHAALNALTTLDRYRAIVLEAKPHEPKRPSGLDRAKVQVSIDHPPAGQDADLVIHFRPERLRNRFLECESDDPKMQEGKRVEDKEAEVDKAARGLWDRILELYRGSHGATATRSDRLVLSMRSEGGAGAAPMLQTRSALGMLNVMSAGDNLVRFAPREMVDGIIERTREASKGIAAKCDASYYRAGDLGTNGEEVPKDAVDHDYGNLRLTRFAGVRGRLGSDKLEAERLFGSDRRLILVAVTGTRPTDAFVAVQHQGAWYSIREDDLISKRNLALVAQITTIQAVPPQSPPLTPTINVGAR